MDKKVNTFIKTLQEKQLTLALAESVTCGMAAHKLATVKGTSEVLAGSIVCYSPEVKHSLLKISKAQIERCTCESREVTHSLANNLTKLIRADIHAALTGLASEGGSESPSKPVGTVFFSVRYKGKTRDYRQCFRGSPLQIRKKACMALYNHILSTIKL